MLYSYFKIHRKALKLCSKNYEFQPPPSPTKVTVLKPPFVKFKHCVHCFQFNVNTELRKLKHSRSPHKDKQDKVLNLKISY